MPDVLCRCPTCRFELTAEAIGVAEQKVEQFEGQRKREGGRGPDRDRSARAGSAGLKQRGWR